MSETRQYGKDTGFLTPDGVKAVQEGTEYELYANIDSLGAMIWRMNHDAADGRIEMTEGMQKDLDNAQYSIEFAVLQTARFGTDVVEPKEGEHVIPTEAYRKWFRWWDNYIKHELTDEQYNELQKLYVDNKDYSKFRPSGDWK